MGRLKILAAGSSPQAQAQARGKLFERLMADVLRRHGYQIDDLPSVNYSGMEIDIEGSFTIAGVPLYAECKCYESEIDSPRLHSFFGKYMAKWLTNNHAHGLFIAIPGVNSHAKGFYREYCERQPQITVRLLEEAQVLSAMTDAYHLAQPHQPHSQLPAALGSPGDDLLLYTDQGIYWLQYLIPPGETVPSMVAYFDGYGTPVASVNIIEHLSRLYPLLNDFDRAPLNYQGHRDTMPQNTEDIVEVQASSAPFEYQFPAAPAYFVGRDVLLADLSMFVDAILHRQTSARGILFEGNSGWGKSSLVLASVSRLRSIGHFAIAIDCRSASSSQFLLRALHYSLEQFNSTGHFVDGTREAAYITGFEGAAESLIRFGAGLAGDSKLAFIFFDQFENLFSLPDVLRSLHDVFLKICDNGGNIVFGFSWKTDLVGLTTEFPYQQRDTISGFSKRIALQTFSDTETTAILSMLSQEIHARLRADLRFLLAEFSQGYPWLLKKLCAHVKSLREAGVSQSDIAQSVLNVEQLFQDDLEGLTPEQEDTLRRIAKTSPISVLDLSDDLRQDIVQSLVDRRLVVRIGSKLDVYWDIFRDYLNSGQTPVQDNYILRIKVNSIVKALTLLRNAGGELSSEDFRKEAEFSEKSFYNMVRELRLLGLAQLQSGMVRLVVSMPPADDQFIAGIRVYVRERLSRNRLVRHLLEVLEATGSLRTEDIASRLAGWCPYISASKDTWRFYAMVLCEWIDTADLAMYDNVASELARYENETAVRERQIVLARRRGGQKVLQIQYDAVAEIAVRIASALRSQSVVD
jgi:hypothetical protein